MKSRKNGRIWRKKKILFHQDNAPVHTSVIAMAKINELKFELLPHTPYSPDLAPSDYFLFPKLKKWLAGKRFANNEEVESAVDGYFEELDNSHYKQGIEATEHRWKKCISLKGDYVEK
jgi:histone-lysine N-methyltransferase SETMAR